VTRPDFDNYFMKMAEVAATRATCDRKHVGAVIVVKGCLVSTGYNGAPRKLPHCDSQGHELVEFMSQEIVEDKEDGTKGAGPVVAQKSCIRTIHAEMNAIAQAAKNGVAIDGGTLYTTASACYDCAKVIVNAGILRVVAKEKYQSRYGKSGNVDALFEAAGVESFLLSPKGPGSVTSTYCGKWVGTCGPTTWFCRLPSDHEGPCQF